ncbi:MAG TPA: hypothetical protein VGE16_15225 [Albitalea sp.]
MKTPMLACAAAALALALSGCTEEPQTANPRKSDTRAWQGTGNAYVAPGWTAGDKTSWEEQMRTRAQAQNEYARVR